MSRKKYERMPLEYNLQDETRIMERIGQLLMDNPGISFREAQVMEVIDRYRGENGLSEHKVFYLTAAIMKILEYPEYLTQHELLQEDSHTGMSAQPPAAGLPPAP